MKNIPGCTIVILLIFCYLSNFAYARETEKSILYKCLYSQQNSERHKAFNAIAAVPRKYADNILAELQSYSSNPNKAPDALFYLAVLVKDKRFINPLITIISRP